MEQCTRAYAIRVIRFLFLCSMPHGIVDWAMLVVGKNRVSSLPVTRRCRMIEGHWDAGSEYRRVLVGILKK